MVFCPSNMHTRASFYLQAVCPGIVEGMDKPSDNHRDLLNSSFSRGSFEGSASEKGNEDFSKKIKQFIASKADLLFSMEGKRKLQKGVNYGRHPNQEVLDLYADTPPLETLLELPLHVRRTQLFKCLKEGDIIIGKVSCKRPFGIIVTLTMLEYGCNRDFTDLDIQALCKSSELHSSPEYKDQTDAFVIGDVLRAVVIDVNVEENRILISLRHSRLPKAHEHLHLGIIEEPDTVLVRLQSNPEGLTYDEHLSKHKGFNNPRNIETLTELLGIDTSAPCSLLRCFQRNDCPEGDYAEPLRKQQSAKWSMETTAKGVEHFKAGNFDAALKYFEHALQIDGENVEALVARGAL
ncbi:PREDICTED: tetratricopeptide repeat protein 14-like [Acropora digitifera]|uniref:tetratricopeptide repeat protein 14-like n=1 Tax=Acropora digitifera TaxID=70779 RepID=UPI00077AE77A|nr:PREDICTED: tetratricopeptide repeat protein 14-like [Acropora digitifera]